MKKSLLLIPFLLISCGKSGSSSSSQEGKAIPSIHAENEVEYISKFLDEDLYYTLNTKGILPKMDDSRYINVETHHDLNEKNLNYVTYPEGVKVIKITALDLRLGGSKTHSIYELLKKTFDVKKVIILARKVEIFDELHIAGGDIEIRAEEVYFQGNGKINTTPVTKSELPKSFQDGQDGLRAGDIKIVANSITQKYPRVLMNGEDAPFLVANGGDGQGAGPGLDGARGANAYLVSHKKVYKYKVESCERRLGGGRNKSASLDSIDGCSWSEKKGRPSTNGQDAKVGGKPGAGGMPGTIYLSQKFETGISNHTGKSGTPDRERVGGIAGTPSKVCKYKKPNGENGKYYDCIEVKNGKSVSPKITITSFEKGKVENISESFVNPEFFKMLNLYATDAYKQNQVEFAKDLYKKIDEGVSALSLKDLTTMSVKDSVSANLIKIDSHKDYYGHEKVWTPNIAFEVSYKIFEKEMKSSLKNLFFVRSLMQKETDLEDKKNLVRDMSEELYQGITYQREAITNAVLKSNAIMTAKEELEVSESEFQFELKKIEEEIRRDAKRSLATPFLNQALKVISVASKCIPVGQPAFAAVGAAADLLDKATTKGIKASDIIKELPNTAQAFENLDWEKATNELDRKLNDLDPSVFANAKNNKERLAYLKELKDFTSPIYKAVSEQIRVFKNQEVSSSKLEQVMNEIKRKDKRFQKVTKALDKLLQKKKHFVKVVEDFNLKISHALDQVSKNYIQMARVLDENLLLLSFENSELATLLDEIEVNAVERLSYYHYLFAKSYEYRMLSPYTKKFSYESLVDKIEKMQKLNTSFDNNIDELLIFYKSELSDIVYKAITDLEKMGLSHQMTETLALSKAQEEALNRGEEVYIDLRNVYSQDKKDIRLHSVRLLNGFEIMGSDSSVELMAQHSGTSLLKSSGKTFIFKHDNINQPNLTWFSSKGIGSNEVSYSELSIQDGSLFVEMLGISEETKLLTQPGGRTFISLKLRKHQKTQIRNLRLELDYSFKL